MKIGFTGTRKGMSARQKQGASMLLEALSASIEEVGTTKLEVHHGDCIGADADFDLFCRRLGVRRVLHPSLSEPYRAHSEKYGLQEVVELCTVLPPEPPLDRDRTIVEEVKLLIAAPAQRVEQLRSGTWATIRYAREEGVPVVILDP